MADGFFDEGYELFGYEVRKVARSCLGEVPQATGAEWKLVLGFQSPEYKHACRVAKKRVKVC